MRHAMIRRLPPALARGLTLIEVMIAFAIGVMLLTVATPYFGDYVVNSRMREGANGLLAQALYAQSEALKRNAAVRLTIDATGAQITLVADGTLLRSHTLGNGVTADAATIDFGNSGLPTPLGTELAVNVVASGVTCSDELRCPGLRIDGGGGIRVCSNKLYCS